MSEEQLPEPTVAELVGDEPLPVMPILRTFAQARPVRVLQGLAELSFVAGRAGDEPLEWREEAEEALIDAFKFERVSRIDWFDTARAALERAYEAGVAQREIDLTVDGQPNERALAVARAQATIYADEIDHPSEACPSAIDSAAGRVAFKLAERHPVSAPEAALIAMAAFRAEGLIPSIEVAARTLDRARFGHAERVATEERAARRAQRAAASAAALFGGVE